MKLIYYGLRGANILLGALATWLVNRDLDRTRDKARRERESIVGREGRKW